MSRTNRTPLIAADIPPLRSINERDPGEQKEKSDVNFDVDSRDSSESKRPAHLLTFVAHSTDARKDFFATTNFPRSSCC